MSHHGKIHIRQLRVDCVLSRGGFVADDVAFLARGGFFCPAGLERGFDYGVGGVSEGSGDVVLVPADAFVYARVLEGVLIVVEAGRS